MKRRTGRRRLAGLLAALAMAVGLASGMSLTAYAGPEVWDSAQTISADASIADGVNVVESITLTIDEGKKLTVNGGIYIPSDCTLIVAGKGTLEVTGKTGATGSTGNPGTDGGNPGGTGGQGGNGGNGGVGIEGTLVVDGAAVTVTGGKGGTGGTGGIGGTGENHPPGEQGKDGGPGGQGGNGGDGGVGIKGTVTVNSGTIVITGGDAGDAGQGGAGGNGGAGSPGGSRGGNGNPGNPGTAASAVSGTITENEDAQESDDGSAWSAISGTTSAKRYVKVAHLHNFTYSADGATITATCGKIGCDLTDNQATLTIAAPALTTYGGSESAEATITDADGIKGSASVAYYKATKDGDAYTKTDEAINGAPTEAGDYVAEITLENVKTSEGEGKSVTASVGYTIAKADPTAAAPAASATYGQTLADVTLENPEGNTPGTWAFVDAGTTSVGDASATAKTFKANFTPTDTANYKSVDNVNVSVKVGKADATDAMKAATATLKAKSGETAAVGYELPDGASYGNVTNDNADFFTVDTSSGIVLTAAKDWTQSEWGAEATRTFNVAISGATNYNDYALTVTVTPTYKAVQTITAADVEATYGATDAKVSATTDGNGAISYAVKDGSEGYIEVAADGKLTIKKAGTATVTVTAEETETHERATKDVAVTIDKAAPAVTAPTAKSLTYSGQAQGLVEAGSTEDGTIYYALGEDATTVPEEGWSTTVPTGAEVGTYHVWYRVAGDENHNDTEAGHVESTIRRPAPSKVNIARAEVTADPASFAYDGTAKEPALKVTLGGRELAEGTDYVASFSGNVEAGTATATVTGKGRYTGAAKATFAIEPADVSKAQVKLAQDSFAYDGKAKEPAVVSVTLGGRTLEAGTDYSVSYENNVEAGTAYAVVTGKGNYKGAAEAAFSIEEAKPPAPVKTDISKAKVTLAKKKCIYDGKAQEPAVASVVLNGKTLAAGTDYTVSYENNTEPGTARAIVTGKGAYEGTAKASFKVALKKAKLSATSKPAAGSLAANWAAVPGAEGYELQWRASRGAWQTRAVSATSATVKGLKSGSLCDVRVRAVAGKAKGAWSPVRHLWLARTLGVTAKPGKRGSVDVTWKASPEATAGYLVVARYAKGGKNAAKLKVSAGETSATFTGLKSGKKVWVLVAPLRSDSGKTFRGVLSHTTRSTATVR